MRYAFLIALFLLPLAITAHAAPSQTDVFKSIQDSVSNKDESNTNLTPWVCGGIGVIIILAVVSQRQNRQATPKVVNHAGRLTKELLRKLPIRPREMKQLKTLADEIPLVEGDTLHPLTLILCPSVMIKAVNERSTRADRRTLVGVLRKMGIR